MTFKSKIDWWMIPLLLMTPATALILVVTALIAADGALLGVSLGTTAFVALLYVGLVWPIEYQVNDETLRIRFGLVKVRIATQSIHGVKPSRSILGAPALSMDRLHIDYGTGLGTWISPADKNGFLDALDARCPHLRRESDCLVPDES